jgi:hypothetical protein
MRMSVPAALAAFVLAQPVLLGAALSVQAPAAHAAASIFLETNPSTVPAGNEVALRASCDDNLKSATVTSGLFGTVTVSPKFGFLTTTVTVPASTRPGDYQLDLHCPQAGVKIASSMLHVVAKVAPARGPATGGGGMAPGRNAPVLIGGGLAVFAAGLVLGGLSLRRRRLG